MAVWKRNLYVVGGRRRPDQLHPGPRRRPAAASTGSWAPSWSFNDEDLKSLLLFGGGAAAGAASK